MAFELGPRYGWNDRPSSNAPGIYGYFVNSPDVLGAISVPASGPLYIGMTDSSLDARCHFEHRHSGFSTLRRSLGAILKGRLRLRSLPRAPGPSRTNVLCYRFDTEGEAQLTEWMRENLSYSYREITGNIAAAEKDAIMSACPPLNLKGWKNGQRDMIKRLRALCAAEASLSRDSTPFRKAAMF